MRSFQLEKRIPMDITEETQDKQNQKRHRPESEEQNINNKDTSVNTQIVANRVEKINQFFKVEKEASSFDDPTDPLPQRSSELPDFDLQEELENNFKKLEQERIILIDCFDERVSLAAFYGLIERLEVKDYENRMLTFSGENRRRTDLHIGIFANEKIKIGGKEKLIILISLNTDSQSFFDSMFIKDRIDIDRIKQTLCEKHILLVCMINSDLIRETLKVKRTEFSFPYWNIPFLPLLMKLHFSESEAKYFENKVFEQKKDGLWGENEESFYKLIQSYLRDVEQFKKEIEKRSQYREGNDVKEFLQNLKPVKPYELLKDEAPIKKTVLYIATFFPNLSPHDFEQLVLLLLEGKKITTYEKSYKEIKNNEVKTIETPVEKYLTEIWNEHSCSILEECYIKTVRLENSLLIVDFSEPYLRGEFKRYLEKKDFLYVQRQFERFRDVGLLFNFNVSEKVIENLIILSAEMAVSDPDYYGENRLFNIIIANLEESEFLEQQLIDLKKKEIVILRLSELIREMLNYPQLKKIIKNFFKVLMQTQHHDLMLEIILGITKRLRFMPQFDVLYWIKNLLDQGQKEVKEQAYAVLLEQAKQSGFRIYELLKTVQEWLPERDRDFKKYSSSNQYALGFIIHYCVYTFYKLTVKDYGCWPSRYPLFATLLGDERSAKKLELLVAWFFHPGMQFVLDKIFIDENIDDEDINNPIHIDELIADFLEIWFVILYGLKKEPVHPEAFIISDMLLKSIYQILKTYEVKEAKLMKKKLIDNWQQKQASYLAEIEESTSREQKVQLKNERKILLELKKKFKEIVLIN